MQNSNLYCTTPTHSHLFSHSHCVTLPAVFEASEFDCRKSLSGISCCIDNVQRPYLINFSSSELPALIGGVFSGFLAPPLMAYHDPSPVVPSVIIASCQRISFCYPLRSLRNNMRTICEPTGRPKTIYVATIVTGL